MDFGSLGGGRVQYLQAQLFPVCTLTPSTAGGRGFLGSFLSKGLKTNQLELNTDEKTLRPIARLKEPRDLFALPKDKDHDCSQQAPRWPIECQVIEERIVHIPFVPAKPEKYNQPTGNELKPRPVGEENGIVVFNYNPISAVNYHKKKKGHDSSDSDISSSESRGSTPECSTPDRRQLQLKNTFSKLLATLDHRSSSNSMDEYEDDEDDCDTDDCDEAISTPKTATNATGERKNSLDPDGSDEIEDIWGNKSPEYQPSTPTYIKSQFGKEMPKVKVAIAAIPTKPVSPFSRSSVGGSKFMTNCHPYNAEDYDGLEFESRFESGNLAKAVKITQTYYELYLRPDLYTSRSKQWFYFRVKKTKKNLIYRFSIVNLVKSDSLYNDGMRPLMYSSIDAKQLREGWKRCGQNIAYYRNDDDNSNEEDEDNSSYTLTFNVEFAHDDDTVYFAHSYPYTYSELQDYLMAIQKDPVKSKFCKLRLLCRSLAGNNVYYLTITAPTNTEEAMKRKKSIVVSARVHPSETPSSWMMKGLMDFITGETTVAKRLRHRFIFKLIPMLNPDGVIVGNTRNSLTGKDLNRQYRTVIRETYPSIWYTKAMIKRLIDESGVAMYCDMHAHSRKHNIFIYGCENKRNPEKKLTEQVFPLMMHKNVADKFSFESCKFKIQRSKEGTGRIVVWMLGITNSYTIEASFGGTSLGARKGTHFTTADYEHMGRAFCETLLDYGDENPNKERLRLKIIERLLKEGSSADEPLNIPLSDYSSDEGDSSTTSDNDIFLATDSEGPCCAPLKAPPSSPEINTETRRNRKSKLRNKPLVHRKKADKERTPLDLPTTDPGSDIHFSTDDEFYIENPEYPETEGGNLTLPRTRRNLLQSELQRRYIEEIGDGSSILKLMPPELIVTSPTKQTSSKHNLIYKPPPKTAPGNSPLGEFPKINGPARRISSWHNLHNSGKCVPKLRVQNPYQMNSPLDQNYTDDLKLKLSLKKRIWTGLKPDNGGQNERNRPLSWGVPPLGSQLKSQKVSHSAMIIRDENEALFNACSQKLLAWQNDTNATSPALPSNRNKLTVNIVMPEIDSEAQTVRFFKQLAYGKKTPKSASTKLDNNEGKVKKRKNPLSKIAETTQLLTRFAKSKQRLSISTQRQHKGAAAPTSHIQATSNQKMHSQGNRFKTGGLVATAVQVNSKKKLRAINTNHKTAQHSGPAGDAAATRAGTSAISRKQSGTSFMELQEALQTTSLVRKVKTKLKKKKSPGSNNGMASIPAEDLSKKRN